MEDERKQGHSAPRRIAFVALTWCLALVLVEAVVRVAMPEVGRTVYPGYPDGLIESNDTLGHAYVPGFAGYFPAPEYRDVPIRINSYGFRDVEWPAEPDETRPRVMVLGDSITFGSPIRREDRFTEQATAVLEERGRPVETCNCGVNGYGVGQYAVLLRETGPRLRPRAVLIGLCLNDAEPVAESDARTIAAAEAVAAGGAWPRLVRFARGHRLDLGQSYAFNLARRSVKTRLWASARFGPEMAARYSEKTESDLAALYSDGDGIARLREALSDMQGFARESLGAELGVVVFPFRFQVEKRDPAISERIDGLLAELAVPYRDLYGTFIANADAEGLYVPGDDCHPDAFGHRLTGEAVANLLDRMLPERAPENPATATE